MPDRLERRWIGREVCKWVIGTLAVAIVGDTARPSGKGSGAFGVTPGGPASTD